MRFGVMGATTHVVVVGGDEERLQVQARTRLEELERRWSRHLSRSDVSQLNRRAGRLTMVSRETFALVDHAVDAWWRTAGRFDPTVTRPRRPFDDVPTADLSDKDAGCHGIRLWPLIDGVTVPAGIELDLVAIGRAYAADIVAAELVAAGAEGASVNIGGDVRCTGRAPTDEGWVLGVRGPRDEVEPDVLRREVAHIVLQDGGVATTRYANGPWSAATIITSEAWRATVIAQALSTTAAADAETLLRAWNATALLFTHDGELVSLSGVEPAAA